VPHFSVILSRAQQSRRTCASSSGEKILTPKVGWLEPVQRWLQPLHRFGETTIQISPENSRVCMTQELIRLKNTELNGHFPQEKRASVSA
jgi:hypothetical protein